MEIEFIKLETIIKEKCKNQKVYYMANNGNFGDGLIRYGTLKFFTDIGLKYKEVNSLKRFDRLWWESKITPFQRDILIYGGGGAWCKLWNHEYIIKNLKNRFKHIIVLPSSYEFKPAILDNVTYISRDKFQSLENNHCGIFCHDMALYLNKINCNKGKNLGYFFRTDKESSGKLKIPKNNIDLSLLGDHNSPIYKFLMEIEKYKIIYTDRLHVAIAALLMDKEVHLYPGSYFKIKAIYNSSLKNRFKHLYFHEDMIFQKEKQK